MGEVKKVVVVGSTGTIGSAVYELLRAEGFDVVGASRHSEVALDLESVDSIRAFFEQVGQVDAVVCAMGSVPFVSLSDMSEEDLRAGVGSKMLGQLNLVVGALPYLRDGGSFTLTTGILTQHPIEDGVIATAANGGVEAFVRAAVTDLPRGIRINAVSPTMLEEARESYGPFFRGFNSVRGADVAMAYLRSICGVETGQIFKVW